MTADPEKPVTDADGAETPAAATEPAELVNATPMSKTATAASSKSSKSKKSKKSEKSEKEESEKKERIKSPAKPQVEACVVTCRDVLSSRVLV